MLIDKKSLQTLQILKIKHSPDEFPLPSNYLFIDGRKCLFISKYKNKQFHILASPECKLSFVDSQSYFNVIFTTEDFHEAVSMFYKYIKDIL